MIPKKPRRAVFGGTMRAATGKWTGNYMPTTTALECLADQRKDERGSISAWAKKCHHDDETMKKALEMAREPGVLAAYGAEPRKRMQKVAVHYEYVVDPEPLGDREGREALGRCLEAASQRGSIMDQIESSCNCWEAFGHVEPLQPAGVPREPSLERSVCGPKTLVEILVEPDWRALLQASSIPAGFNG